MTTRRRSKPPLLKIEEITPADVVAHRRDSLPAVSGTSDPVDMGKVGKLAGGRISMDSQAYFLGNPQIVLPPPEPGANWRMLTLDQNSFDRMAPHRILETLADLSPDVSNALWVFLRLCNPGVTVSALRADSKGQLPDNKGQKILDSFLGELKTRHGSVDVIYNRLFLNGFMRGAFFGELVLDADGKMPLDIAVPDAYSARFRREMDPVLGVYWELGQWQLGGFTPLLRPTVRYVPIDPFPAIPYGRPIAGAAVFITLFLLGLMHDLRRVISQQGYPRIDLSIDLVALQESMPEDAAKDPETFLKWANAITDQVTTAYGQLEPDDAYVHTSVVNVNRPVGALDSNLSGVDGIIKALERMGSRALKTMPLLQGLSEAGNETTSNRQWEVSAAGIRSVQNLNESLLEHFFSLVMRAQGNQAVAQVHFDELRAAELFRDAQTKRLDVINHIAMYQAGWESQDQAAMAVTGHKADSPEPRQTAMDVPNPDAIGNKTDNTGSDKAQKESLLRWLLNETQKDKDDVREGTARPTADPVGTGE